MKDKFLLMGTIDGFGVIILVLALIGLICLIRFIIKWVIYLIKGKN